MTSHWLYVIIPYFTYVCYLVGTPLNLNENVSFPAHRLSSIHCITAARFPMVSHGFLWFPGFAFCHGMDWDGIGEARDGIVLGVSIHTYIHTIDCVDRRLVPAWYTCTVHVYVLENPCHSREVALAAHWKLEMGVRWGWEWGLRWN